MFEGVIQSLNSIAAKLVNAIPVTPRLAFTPAIANFAASTKYGRYRQIGSEVDVNYKFLLSATPTGNMTITLPTYVANQNVDYLGQAWVVRQGAAYHLGTCFAGAGTNTFAIHKDNSGSVWNATVPVALQSGDYVVCQLRYEAKI